MLKLIILRLYWVLFCVFITFNSANSENYFDKYYVVVDEVAPYRIIEEWDGEIGHSGIYVDTIKEVSRRTGLEFVFIQAPFSRALAMITSGQADMMLGTVWNSEAEKHMEFLDASFPLEPVTFLIDESASDIRFYDELQGLNIGVLRSARYFEPFDSDMALAKFEVTNFQEGARMLAHERIDALILPEYQADHILQQPGTSLRKSSFKTLGTRAYITVSRKSGLLKRSQEIEDAFAELNLEGYFERLMEVYLFP